MRQGMRSTMNRISSTNSASFAHLSHLHISVSEVQAQINNEECWPRRCRNVMKQEELKLNSTSSWSLWFNPWQELEVSQRIMLLQLSARAARRWCPVDKANCQQSEGSWLHFTLLPEEETTCRKSSKGELCFARVMQWNYVKGAMSMWKRSYLLEYLYLDINKAMIGMHCRSSLESETMGLNCSGALRYHLQDCAAARGSHHIATSSAYASINIWGDQGKKVTKTKKCEITCFCIQYVVVKHFCFQHHLLPKNPLPS